jgi:hypothetical protein
MINHSRRCFFISQTALYGSAAVSLTLEESPSFFDGLRNINKSSANYSRVEQLAARQSHKLKAAGSSPAPATIFASALCFSLCALGWSDVFLFGCASDVARRVQRRAFFCFELWRGAPSLSIVGAG